MAMQPNFKTHNNQRFVIPGQEHTTQHVASIPQPSFGERMGSVINDAKTPLLDYAQQAATQAAINTGTKLAEHAATNAQALAIKYGSTAMTKATQSMSKLLSKIIGDAPPSTTLPPGVNVKSLIDNMKPVLRFAAVDAMTSQNQKIIGDAPPGAEEPGVMTAEQQDAAMANISSSPAMNLVAELLLQEQTMHSSRSFMRNMSFFELNYAYLIEKLPTNASFNQSPATIVSGIRGTGFSYNWASTSYLQAEGGVLYLADIPSSIMQAKVQPPAIAPPLGGNTTLEALKPLLSGASISEYSSALRTKTQSTDIDRVMRAFGIASNSMTANSGYSFALPLIKILGYVLTRLTVIGEGVQNMVSGVDRIHEDDILYATRYHPYFDSIVPGNQVPLSFRACAINENNFIDIISGIIPLDNIDQRFLPQHWGVSVAVVFVPSTEAHLNAKNAVKVCAALGYPIRRWHRTGHVSYVANNGTLQTANNESSFMCPHANEVFIDGPGFNVLFVITGINDNAGRDVSFGFNNYFVVNSTDDSINDPSLLDIDVVYDNLSEIVEPQTLPVVSSWIREWETVFGSNSDRSTALRFWADASRRYGNVDIMAGPAYAGGDNAIRAQLAAFGYMGGPVTPEQADIPIHILATGHQALQDMYYPHCALRTTATGCKPMVGTWSPANGNNYDFTREPNFHPIHYILPSEDFLINWLVIKKQVFLAEEYPDETLSDLGRASMTVALMSNILCGLTDLAGQVNDVEFKEFIAPELTVSANTPVRRVIEAVFYPALDRILTMGIQFPSMIVDHNANLTTRALLTPITIGTMFGQGVVDNLAVGTYARIPRHDLAQFANALEIDNNTIRLNYPQMMVRKVIENVEEVRVNLFTAFINSDDMPGISDVEYSILQNMFSRLSLGSVGTQNAANPGVLIRSRNSQILRRHIFSVQGYAIPRSFFLAGQQFEHARITPVTLSFFAIPHGQNLLTRDSEGGYEPYRLIMAGPADAFGAGSGTYNYIMIYVMAHGSLAFTTNSFATVPESVFSGSGIGRLMSGF